MAPAQGLGVMMVQVPAGVSCTVVLLQSCQQLAAVQQGGAEGRCT